MSDETRTERLRTVVDAGAEPAAQAAAAGGQTGMNDLLNTILRQAGTMDEPPQKASGEQVVPADREAETAAENPAGAETAPAGQTPPAAAGGTGLPKGDPGSSAEPAQAPVDARSAGSQSPAPQADGAGAPPEKPGAGTSAGSGGKGGDDDDGEDDDRMTLMDHLRELRRRLVYSLIAAGVGFAVCMTFIEPIFSVLTDPLLAVLPAGSSAMYTTLPEAFFTRMFIAFVVGLFLVSPFIFYQIWSFISPGLYDEEKHFIIPVAVVSALFFIGGGLFCYYIVFHYAFQFFMSFATEQIVAMPRIKDYLDFVLKLLIAFGLVFEMPIFAFFLSRMGVVTAAVMRRGRRYAVLIVFIVAAIMTPPDVISQLLMAVPMLLLYEVSILVAAVCGKKKGKDANIGGKDDKDGKDGKDGNDGNDGGKGGPAGDQGKEPDKPTPAGPGAAAATTAATAGTAAAVSERVELTAAQEYAIAMAHQLPPEKLANRATYKPPTFIDGPEEYNIDYGPEEEPDPGMLAEVDDETADPQAWARPIETPVPDDETGVERV